MSTQTLATRALRGFAAMRLHGPKTQGRCTVGHQFEPLSYQVWGACIEVQRQLGPHCMEVDYQRALEIALSKRATEFIREAEIPIYFDGVVVTKRRVDFVAWDDNDTLLLEIKAAKAIRDEDVEQCLLYLRNGHFRTCLLANFGQVPLGKQRLVHTPAAPALYGPRQESKQP